MHLEVVATVPRPFQTEDYYIYCELSLSRAGMICSEGFADLLLTVVTTPLPILIVRCATRSAANLANHKVCDSGATFQLDIPGYGKLSL